MKPRKLLQTLCPFIILLPGFTFAYDLSPKEQAAVEWVREGKSYEEVAEEFDTTPAHVYRWVRIEEGITGELIAPPLRDPDSFTPRERARAVQMITVERQKMADVARDFDTSPAEIYRWVMASRARPARPSRQTRQVRIDAPSTDQDIEPSRQRRGGQGPKLDDAQKAEVIRLAKEGELSHGAIGRRFGVTGRTIGRVVREYEVSTGEVIPRHTRAGLELSDAQKAEVIRLAKEGELSHRVIGRRFGVTGQTIGNVVREYEVSTGEVIPRRSQRVHSEETKPTDEERTRGTPAQHLEQRTEATPLVSEGGENVTETERQSNERREGVSHQAGNQVEEMGGQASQQSQYVRSDEPSTDRDVESSQQPQRRRAKLSDEQRAKVIQLAKEEELSHEMIGRRFGVSKGTISRVIHEYKVSTGEVIPRQAGRQPSENVTETARQPSERSEDVAQIPNEGEEMGASQQSQQVRSDEPSTGQDVESSQQQPQRGAIRQLPSDTRRNDNLQKQVEAVRLLKAGESIEDVAEKFNVSFETIVEWFEKIQHVKLGWLGAITTAGTLLYHIFSSDVLSADEMGEGLLEVFDGVIWAEELANSDLQNLDTPSIEIMDFLDRLKRQLEGYIDNGLILSEEVKEGVFEQLAEAQQKMVLDDTLDMDTRIEIYNRMADIEDLILSSQT